MIIKRCDTCHNQFETKRNVAKFCSRKCIRVVGYGESHPGWKGKTLSKKCLVCAELFITRHEGIFCSKDCYGRSKRNRIKKNCLICDKEFEICLSEEGRKYCSKECEIKSRTGVRRSLSYDWAKGENSYFWKGGVTKLAHGIRNLVEYKIWRAKIFERDNYQCVNGNHGNKLNADHIKSFATILRENNIRTIEDAICCGELWGIKNGRTLCVNCHKKTDTYLKNTKTLKK